MDWYYNMAMLPYGTWWRRHRRTFNEHFHASTIWKYQSMQAREVRAFLNRLLTTPDNFLHHIRQYVFSFRNSFLLADPDIIFLCG
jgi:cytochrome P450